MFRSPTVVPDFTGQVVILNCPCHINQALLYFGFKSFRGRPVLCWLMPNACYQTNTLYQFGYMFKDPISSYKTLDVWLSCVLHMVQLATNVPVLLFVWDMLFSAKHVAIKQCPPRHPKLNQTVLWYYGREWGMDIESLSHPLLGLLWLSLMVWYIPNILRQVKGFSGSTQLCLCLSPTDRHRPI